MAGAILTETPAGIPAEMFPESHGFFQKSAAHSGAFARIKLRRLRPVPAKAQNQKDELGTLQRNFCPSRSCIVNESIGGQCRMAEHLTSKQITEALTALLHDNIGRAISRSDIEKTYLRHKPSQDGRSELTLKWTTVDHHLQAAAQAADAALSYDGPKTKPAFVTPFRRQTKYEERKDQSVPAKQRIGRALWSLLFQANYLQDETGFHSVKNFANSEVASKVDALSRRTGFLALIDAGSTTRIAVEQLVAARTMPVVVSNRKGVFQRMVRPDIVTNSPEILDVLVSAPHVRGAISLSLISGEYDWELNSLSGISAVQHLMKEQIVADVAIVGITGARRDNYGYGFGCDNLSQSLLKANFLERSLLKILIFQSSKLRLGSEVRNLFSRLSPNQVDVLITDNDSEFQTEIGHLGEHAKEVGVEVVLA